MFFLTEDLRFIDLNAKKHARKTSFLVRFFIDKILTKYISYVILHTLIEVRLINSRFCVNF